MEKENFISKHKVGEDMLKDLNRVIEDERQKERELIIVRSMGTSQIDKDLKPGDIFEYYYYDKSGDMGICVFKGEHQLCYISTGGYMTTCNLLDESEIEKVVVVDKKGSEGWSATYQSVFAPAIVTPDKINKTVGIFRALGLDEELIKGLTDTLRDFDKFKKMEDELSLYKKILGEISPIVKEIAQKVTVKKLEQ